MNVPRPATVRAISTDIRLKKFSIKIFSTEKNWNVSDRMDTLIIKEESWRKREKEDLKLVFNLKRKKETVIAKI